MTEHPKWTARGFPIEFQETLREKGYDPDHDCPVCEGQIVLLWAGFQAGQEAKEREIDDNDCKSMGCYA